MVDAGVVLHALLGEAGFALLEGYELVAPPLLWSEVRSVLHEQLWRGALQAGEVATARRRMTAMPVAARNPPELGDVAWGLADELGMAKTHDAEYLALARLLGYRLLTVDRRLRQGAARLGMVVEITEL